MNVTLYPFFSQQDKRTNNFRLDSDSGVKLYAFMAEKFVERGDTVFFVLPQEYQCATDVALHKDVTVLRPPFVLSPNNLDRRLQWEPSWLRNVAKTDLLLTQHEFLAYPLRCLAPKLRIIMECGIRPETAYQETAAMFELAWNAASLIHCNSQTLAQSVSQQTNTPTTEWQFAYDERDLHPGKPIVDRKIDVLFPSRASSTSYSNHELFIQAMTTVACSVLMTDPTNFLRHTNRVQDGWLPKNPLVKSQYYNTLGDSKVVVGLTDNGYGGYAFREAIASGCIPVALRCPEYEELLTPDWPYLVADKDPELLRRTVIDALNSRWGAIPTKLRMKVQYKIMEGSYETAWKRAAADMRRLL
jgi:hypothetical protein